MGGIFSNDYYNNGVTRDNFREYAYTYHNNPRDPHNYIPPREPNNNNGNNNRIYRDNKKPGGGKAKKLGIVIFIVLIIWVVVHIWNSYMNMQDMQYFQERRDEAQARLNYYEDKYGYFLIPFAYGEPEEEVYRFVICPDNFGMNITYPTGTSCHKMNVTEQPTNK